MEENNSKKISSTIVVILIVIGLALMAMIKVSMDNLTDAIVNHNSGNTNDNTVIEQDYDYDDWEYRFDELEAKIDEQSRNIEDIKITFGECSAEKKTVDVKISVIPKEYTKDTKVTATVGEYSSELNLKKKKFLGIIQVPYDEVYEICYIAIETDGKVRNEKIILDELDEYEDFWNWDYELIDRVYGESEYNSNFEDNKYNLQLKKAIIEVDAIENGINFPTLYVTKNDGIVFQQTMKYNEKKKCYEGSCNKTFDFENKDKFRCYAEYIGKSGLKYRVKYFAESYDGYETYDEDSTVVYGTNGKKIEFKYMDEE